jgi:choline dehydrogenase-like flavoprotein
VEFDVVIVGSGSSGGALAARLSEDPQRSVLLLEAGPVVGSVEELPEEIRRADRLAAAFPGHPNNWNLVGNLTPQLRFPIPRGKIMGGSSSINGALFTRGAREDFDSWEALGNPAWSWERVLPFFKKLEDDRDFQDDHHGVGGPITVVRESPERMSPITEGFMEACDQLGFPEERDKNAPGPPGIGLVPCNIRDGIRISTAIAYLIPNLSRPNLHIRGNAYVRRVIFDGTRATGVEVEVDGRHEVIRGGEIVLSAGAIKSPHLLLLSGIGPAEELRALGIPVVQDLPAVGKDFTDHPDVLVHYRAVEGLPSDPDMFMAQAMLNYTADGSETVGGMEIFPVVKNLRAQLLGSSRSSWLRGIRDIARRPLRTLRSFRGVSVGKALDDAMQQSQYRILVNVQQEESRGELRIVSSDPSVPPQLDYNYFSHPLDRKWAREGVRMVLEMLESTSMRQLVVKRTSPEQEDLSSDAAMDRWISKSMGTAFHTSGTCKMGRQSDPATVVDETCRVHGLDRLRVIDTSIMPKVVRRGPNATAVMIGERSVEFFD